MFHKKMLVMLLALVLGLGVLFAGCDVEDEEPREEVSLGYVMWDCAESSTHVAKVVIEQELGYDVEATPLEPGGLYGGIAEGDVDAMICAWLPVTHAEYMDTYGDEFVELGIHLEGADIGLMVPEYVDIDTIEELNEHADKFNGRIQGIDGGAGIMMLSEEAIDVYGLDNMELIEASTAAMTAALTDAYAEEEWIVVTGWRPHWKNARFDLKYLEDPELVYGEEEHISIMARQNFEEDAPEVANFLENFYWTGEDLGTVMAMVADGEDPLDAARQFVDDNPDLVEEWVN